MRQAQPLLRQTRFLHGTERHGSGLQDVAWLGPDGLPMPDELQEVLNQDPEGDRLFHALTAGKQRSLLYLIGKINDIDKRIHQALIVVDHLKENDGKIIGPKLNEELKRPVM